MQAKAEEMLLFPSLEQKIRHYLIVSPIMLPSKDKKA